MKTSRLAWGASVALVLLAVVVAAMYRRDLDAARERVLDGSRVAATACGPIEYASAGEGQAVLLVHGAGGGFDQGLDFAHGLARAGLRELSVSRFGYLRTPLPEDASPRAQADAYACLLDSLGIARVAVIAASAGAPSAMQFAIRHPERCTALVLVVPAAFVPRGAGMPSMSTPAATRVLFETALKSDFAYWASMHVARASMLRGIVATPPEIVEAATPDERARVERTLRHVLPVTSRRLGLINDAAVTSTLTRYDLEHIAAPTLVISAEDDLFGTLDGARYTADHIPRARLVAYPTGGHLLVGRHAEQAAEIVAFLQTASAGEVRPREHGFEAPHSLRRWIGVMRRGGEPREHR